jgi:carbon-monoxide dehydrogenase medium subunit
MKPAPFDYHAPSSVDEVLALLAQHGNEAAVLAGGQSLLIELRYRDRRPALLVDINKIPALAGLAVENGSLRIGALARHEQLEYAQFDDPLAALLRRTARQIAHPPIRTRGTFVGSLAWAHPAAEWGAVAVALQALLTLQSTAGQRQIAADEWYQGAFTTSREADELVSAVDLPLLGPDTSVRFAELRRTQASFALAAVVVAVRLTGGRITWARIGLANAAEVPLRVVDAERVLLDQEPSPDLIREAAEQAAAEADPVPEPHCSVAYRRHVFSVLVRRCLSEAVERSEPEAQWTSS